METTKRSIYNKRYYEKVKTLKEQNTQELTSLKEQNEELKVELRTLKEQTQNDILELASFIKSINTQQTNHLFFINNLTEIIKHLGKRI